MANLNPDAAVTSSNAYSCCINQVQPCVEKTGESINNAFIKCTNDYRPGCLVGGILCGIGGTTLITCASNPAVTVPVIGNSCATGLGMITQGLGCFSIGSAAGACGNKIKNQNETTEILTRMTNEFKARQDVSDEGFRSLRAINASLNNRIGMLSEENSLLYAQNETLKDTQVITYQPSSEHEAFLQARQARLDEMYPPVTIQPRTVQGNSFFDSNEDADPRFLIRSASFTSLESDAED